MSKSLFIGAFILFFLCFYRSVKNRRWKNHVRTTIFLISDFIIIKPGINQFIKFSIFFFLIISIFSIISCRPNNAIYSIRDINNQNAILLQNWNYIGPIKYSNTSNNYIINDHLLKATGIKESIFSIDPFSYDPTVEQGFLVDGGLNKGYKNSEESIVDFDEISNSRNRANTIKKGSAIYLYSSVISQKEQNAYLLCRSTDGIKVWINGKEVYHTADSRGLKLFFSDFIKIKLKTGRNLLLIKKVIIDPNVLFEAQLCSRPIAIKEYQKGIASLLLYNPISGDSLWLNNHHAKELDTSITYNIQKANGKQLYSRTLSADSPTYIPISTLVTNQSYVCSFTLDGKKVTQSFYKGNPDTALLFFKKLRKSFLRNSNSLQLIDPYIYRLEALLQHESRKTDWWWTSKVANLICELKNCFNDLENKADLSVTSGIQLKAFTSKLDSTTQHYLLITPDNLKRKDKLPLVIVIRPVMENSWHFLMSPQLSRYWSLTWTKYLADKYRYIIALPAARLYTNEAFIPMAESDILQTIDDVSKHYPIDKERLYLHGNCSAGYRSLVMACHYPDVFAAVGLYAPTYDLHPENEWIKKNKPQRLLTNLGKLPIFLHYDPIDEHNPYSVFESFIDDCHKNDLNLQVSSSKYSGLHYNVQLVGEEAFAFFKDKKLIKSPSRVKLTFNNDRYNSAFWLKSFSVKKDKPTWIKADFVKSQNKVTISGTNISEISLNTNLLGINKRKPFIIKYNDKRILERGVNTNTLSIKVASENKTQNDFAINGKVILDFFSEPFLFVSTKDKQNSKQTATDKVTGSLIKEYEESLFSKCPVKDINQIRRKDLETKNIFFIGHTFNLPIIKNGLEKIPLSVTPQRIEINKKIYQGTALTFQAIFISPFNPKKYIIIYSSNEPDFFAHTIQFPWKYGFENIIVN